MSRPDRTRFVLSDYTVELRARGWYFGQAYDQVGDYRGPYTSVASVTLVIARYLRKEIERRHRASVVSREKADADAT